MRLSSHNAALTILHVYFADHCPRSIFSITLGAYMGASDPLLAPIASSETWDVMRLARDSFGDECRYSPSLAVMAESIRVTLSTVRER